MDGGYTLILIASIMVIGHLCLGFFLLIWPGVLFSKSIISQTSHAFLSFAVLERLAFIVFPLLGYTTLFLMSEEDSNGVFEYPNVLALLLFQLLTFTLYFISRKYKYKLGPLFIAVVPALLFLSTIVALVELIHLALLFFICITIGWITVILPFAVLSYYGLLLVSMFMVCEAIAILKMNRTSNRDQLPQWMQTAAAHFYFSNNLLVQIIMFPIVTFLVHIVTSLLFKYKYSPIIDAFTECTDGFISEGGHIMGTGGSEYLVTIAGYGHKDLVKPLFVGYRNGHRIMVNRQLQVCNAFEQIMEENIPTIHKRLRRFYDNLQIPIEKWKHRKVLANVLYLVFLPLEKIFLLVLYMVDKNPELRIQSQYRKEKLTRTEAHLWDRVSKP